MANGDEQLRGQPAGHDMLGRMRLRDSLRATAAGIFGPTRHEHPELGGDHIEPFRHILTDPGHLAAAARALRAGGFDHPFDPGQMRRQMATVALGLTGRFRPRAPQCRLGLFLRGLEHALGQFGIFQWQVELVGRQLLGAFAELLALRGAQDILQPTIGPVRFRQRRLDLGQAGFQHGIFVSESVGIHGSK